MSTIALCSSANFYKQVVELQSQLISSGYEVIIPLTAEKMKETGDFDVSHYKTWYGDKKDYHKKTLLIKAHFEEINKSDAVLVLNFKKHGVDNYIGGNVLMEMALAFYLSKPIFLLNNIPDNSPFLEEIIGLEPIVMNGDVNKLYSKLPA